MTNPPIFNSFNLRAFLPYKMKWRKLILGQGPLPSIRKRFKSPMKPRFWSSPLKSVRFKTESSLSLGAHWPASIMWSCGRASSLRNRGATFGISFNGMGIASWKLGNWTTQRWTPRSWAIMGTKTKCTCICTAWAWLQGLRWHSAQGKSLFWEGHLSEKPLFKRKGLLLRKNFTQAPFRQSDSLNTPLATNNNWAIKRHSVRPFRDWAILQILIERSKKHIRGNEANWLTDRTTPRCFWLSLMTRPNQQCISYTSDTTTISSPWVNRWGTKFARTSWETSSTCQTSLTWPIWTSTLTILYSNLMLLTTASWDWDDRPFRLTLKSKTSTRASWSKWWDCNTSGSKGIWHRRFWRTLRETQT